MEIKKRCELLLRSIRKEFEEHQKELSEPMNTTTMSDTRKPKAIEKRRATTQSIENDETKKKRNLQI